MAVDPIKSGTTSIVGLRPGYFQQPVISSNSSTPPRSIASDAVEVSISKKALAAATALQKQEDEAEKEFNSIDHDQDGLLSQQELVQAKEDFRKKNKSTDTIDYLLNNFANLTAQSGQSGIAFAQYKSFKHDDKSKLSHSA